MKKNNKFRFVNRLVRPFGIIILPSVVIDIMEAEGQEAFLYRKNRRLCRQDDGYYNGISDALGKKASSLKKEFLPHDKKTKGIKILL